MSKAPFVLLCFNAYERELFFPNLEQLPFPTKWVTCGTSEELLTEILKSKPTVLVTCWSTPSIPQHAMDIAGFSVQYICHLAGAVREVVPRCFIERGGIATNWGALVAPQVAEHALLLALALLRNINGWRPFVDKPAETRGGATQWLHTRTLHGKRVGIHGYGVIARSLIQLLAPFGTPISVYSEGVPEAILLKASLAPAASLSKLFRDSETIFECEALTPKNHGSVNRNILSGLPDGAIFVNVARGMIVDEEALLKEVLSGRIQVGLDVLINESFEKYSKWMNVPGAIVSPHIAGPTSDRYAACRGHAINNIEKYIAGNSIAGEISLEAYDRMT